MNKKDFIQVIKETFDSIYELTGSKGEEYSRNDDQLANFKRGALDIGSTKEKVLMILLNKHMDSIKHWILTANDGSEPIESRIDDAILYLILLRAMVKENREPIVYNFITGD